MTPEVTAFLDQVSKLGIPAAILFFVGWILYKLVPAAIARMAVASEQSRIMSEAVPRMEASLRTIAESSSSSNTLMVEMNGKLDLLIAHAQILPSEKRHAGR